MTVALQTPNNGGVSSTEFATACALYRFTDNDLGRTFGDAQYERRRGVGEKRFPPAYLPEIAARANLSPRSISRGLKSMAAKGWWTVEHTGRAVVITWTTKWQEIYAQQARGPLLPRLNQWVRKGGKAPSSMPRTRIPEINSHAAPSAASAPSSSAPTPTTTPATTAETLELPPELEQLPGALEPAEVMEIVRTEHKRAVAIKHPGRSSSAVPTSREVLQWALIVGAFAAAAEDTRAEAVRRGVAIGQQHYMRIAGFRGKDGDLNDQAHPGRWLHYHLVELEASVRTHFKPDSAPRPQKLETTKIEQRELERRERRHAGAKLPDDLRAVVARAARVAGGAR